MRTNGSFSKILLTFRRKQFIQPRLMEKKKSLIVTKLRSILERDVIFFLNDLKISFCRRKCAKY